MTASVIQPFVTQIYRDLRAGVPIEQAVAARATPKAKADFIAAMRRDFSQAGPDATYQVVGKLREMGMPRDWISEAMGLAGGPVFSERPADKQPAEPSAVVATLREESLE